MLLLEGGANGAETLDRIAQKLKERQRGRKHFEFGLSCYEIARSADDKSDLPHAAYYRAVNDHKPAGDRPPLRMFWTVADHEKVNIAQLVLTHENLSRLLAKHKLHEDPHCYARQMLICLRRLLKDYPGLLTQAVEPVSRMRIGRGPSRVTQDQTRDDANPRPPMTPVEARESANLPREPSEEPADIDVAEPPRAVAGLPTSTLERAAEPSAQPPPSDMPMLQEEEAGVGGRPTSEDAVPPCTSPADPSVRSAIRPAEATVTAAPPEPISKSDLTRGDVPLTDAIGCAAPPHDAADVTVAVATRTGVQPVCGGPDEAPLASSADIRTLDDLAILRRSTAELPIVSIDSHAFTGSSMACASPPAPSPSTDAHAGTRLQDSGEGRKEATAAGQLGIDADEEGGGPDDGESIGVDGLLLALSGNAIDLETSPDEAQRLVAKDRRRKPRYEADLSEYAQSSTINERWVLPREAYFRALNDHMPTGDQPRLRKLWAIAEAEEVNVTELVLTQENIARLLQKHGLHPNPKRYANQILLCLGRMLKRHPGLLSQPVELQTKTRIATVPYSRLPNAIRNDLNAWVRMTPIKVKNGPNLAGALMEKSIENYIDSTRTILAAVMLATKEPLDDAVDIALLAQPIAVRCWLPVLDGLSEPTTVCGHLAGLLRMMRDLPDRSQNDIEYLEARQSERMRTPEIDADQRAMVARWEEPALHACLLAAPETLMRIAEDASEGMRTRVLAGASAFAFHLMWEHPSLSQWAIVNFDLVDHVQGEPGARVVLREIPASGAQPARWLATPVSPEGEATWERLLGSRRQMSVLSTLLLPGEDGLARETSAGMEVIYNKIQEVLGERLVATDFRDLNKSLVVPDPEADLDEAAAAFGINRRALERRFAADLQSRYLRPAP